MCALPVVRARGNINDIETFLRTTVRRDVCRVIAGAAVAAVAVLGPIGTAHAQSGEGYRTPPPGDETFPNPDPPQVFSFTPEVTPDDPAVVLPETREPAVANRPRALPVTGGDVIALGAIGGALVAGGALVLGVRRRAAALLED